MVWGFSGLSEAVLVTGFPFGVVDGSGGSRALGGLGQNGPIGSGAKPCLPRNVAFWSHRQRKMKHISWSISAQASPFDFSPPPIDHDFLDTVKSAGAEVSREGIVETFHNDDEALHAADNGVVVADLSHFGRIRVSGEDRVQFLHNQSTANFECLQAGQA